MASEAKRARLTPERIFYLSMIGSLWLTVFAGFSPTFFLRPLFPNVLAAGEPILYIHGVVYSAWLALLALQAGLIAGGHAAWHRRLGLLGFGLAPVLIVMGLYVSAVGARRPTGFTGISDPPLHFFGLMVANTLAFGAFSGAALMLRRRPQAHKRLMLLAAIVLSGAGVARLAGYFPAANIDATWTTAGFLVALAAWDFASRRNLHPTTLWGGVALLGYAGPADAIAATPTWQSIAEWAIGLIR
jgi:hypothetical protein